VTGKASRDRLRVAAMIEAAEDARRDSDGGKESFDLRGMAQRAILLDLIHFTESAERTSPAFKKGNSSIPWQRLSSLRNHGLVHDYAEVDMEDIWNFVRDELPRIRRKLDRAKYPDG